MEEKIIAAFKSRSQLMSFDAAMRRAGIKTEIVPTPRAVALGCGLSAAFSKKALQTAICCREQTEKAYGRPTTGRQVWALWTLPTRMRLNGIPIN